MADLFDSGDTPTLKAYLRSILGSVVVGDKTIRIIGSKDVLAGAITGRNAVRQMFVVLSRNGSPSGIRTSPDY